MRVGDRYKIQRLAKVGHSADEICRHFQRSYSREEVLAVIGNEQAAEQVADDKEEELKRKRSEAAKKAAATRKAKAEAAAAAEAESEVDPREPEYEE